MTNVVGRAGSARLRLGMVARCLSAIPSAGPLAGKNVLLTGGGTGMGAAIACRFAAEGADVVISGRRLGPLEDTAKKNMGPGRVLIKQGDIADPVSAKRLVDFTTSTLGSVDILVNNAGINIPVRKLGELSVKDWTKVVQVNLNGTFHMIHGVLPQMKARQDGLIINISSIAGRHVTALAGAAYCSSKFGVSALGDAVGVECHEDNIRVTNIMPGECVSEILDKRPNPPSAEVRAGMLQPEDVAAAALMVATLPARAHVPELVINGKTSMTRDGVPMW